MSSIYKFIIVYKRAVDSKSTAYFPARPKLLTSGRTDGQTDRHGAEREITLKRSCNVLKFNHSEKKHAVPIACQKNTAKSI